MQHSTTHCNTLQHTATHCNILVKTRYDLFLFRLQHTATHCNTLQHTATHCNILVKTRYNLFLFRLQHTATHCNTLQHTATLRVATVPFLSYGVATVSRIDRIIGLFCKILSLLQGSFAKETYNNIDPTSRSHFISAAKRSVQPNAVPLPTPCSF